MLPPIAVRALDADQAALVAPMFKALGDPVRLRLMSMIASVPEMCVCDLTPAFDLSGPTISHHLKVLREAGLVDSERRGTWVWYRVRPNAFRQLSALLELPPVRTGHRVSQLTRRASAEFAGTAMLVAAVVGSGIAAVRLSPPTSGFSSWRTRSPRPWRWAR
ncbi:metalloregulator ArsR/SmtB family transcription factor [Micromonospora sp. M12]